MGLKRKRILLPALMLGMLLLCGCRTRTNGSDVTLLPDDAEGRADETRQGEIITEAADWTEAGETSDSSSQTRENPEALRKEFDANAPSEIAPGTDRLLHAAGEGDGASTANEEAGIQANQVNDLAEKTATQTVAAQTADRMGVSEDAKAADSAMTYFTVLLQDRMGSLFECQRQNLYWETALDHVTVHKASPEHALILNAGCYDVSARLLPENLLMDDGWVVRKNPGVIVKLVDGSILGNGVSSDLAAGAVMNSLRSREGWMGIDAVVNHRILLLSQSLLEAPYLQTAAMLMIAKAANPALFSDVDLDQMLDMLMEEATGTHPTGIFYYRDD